MEKKNKEKKKSVFFRILIFVLILAACFGILVWFLENKLKENTDAADASSLQTSSYEEENDVLGTVTYQGKKYRYNDHLSNYLFMGVDTKETTETKTGNADAGQADSLFLISFDRVTGATSIVTIPRDTMTAIELYGPGGESLGETTTHICLAYGYGDGGHKSCELESDAVSNLLYGIPINGYCSISLDAMPLLTESVGGLTVTVPDDSLEKSDPSWTEGTEINLTPENTEKFLRFRDTEVSQSAIFRMNRQEVFLDAFSAKAKEKFAEDPGFVTDLYTSLDPYMVTNMSNDLFVDMMEALTQGAEQNKWTVPGEGTEGELHDEFYADDDALYEKVITSFYKEVTE